MEIKAGDTVVVKMNINEKRKKHWPGDNYRWQDIIHKEFPVKHIEHGNAVLDTDEIMQTATGNDPVRLRTLLIPIDSLAKVTRK